VVVIPDIYVDRDGAGNTAKNSIIFSLIRMC